MASVQDESSEQPGTSRRGAVPAHPRGAHHLLLFGRRRPSLSPITWVVVIATVLLVGVGAVLLLTQVEWAALARAIADLPAGPLVLAMATLPLLAFPILPVYLVAGARFGPIGGGVVVAFITAAHLVGSHLIGRSVLRGPLQRLLGRWHAHLPEIPRDEERMVALIAALVPGLPYFARNYLLATAGLRLRSYFWICLPIYVARSYVSILVGHLGNQPDRTQLLILAAIETLKAAICAFVLWRLREHHRRFHAEPATGSDPVV